MPSYQQRGYRNILTKLGLQKVLKQEMICIFFKGTLQNMLNICSCPLPTCLSFCSLFCFFIGSVWIYTRQSTTVIRLYISKGCRQKQSQMYIQSQQIYGINFTTLYENTLHVGGCCLFVLLFYLKFLDLNSEDEIQKCNNILIPITAGDENRQSFFWHTKKQVHMHTYCFLSFFSSLGSLCFFI